MLSHRQGFYEHVFFFGDLGGSDMSRSRHTITVPIAALLVLLMAATGWSFGPQGPGGGGPGQSTLSGGSECGAIGGRPGGAFNLSAGFGSGRSNGVDSGSPRLDFSSLGMDYATAYNIRGVYTPVRLFPNLNIGFDYTYMHFTGSTGNYQGVGNPILTPGQGADAVLDVGLVSVMGDYLPVIDSNGITVGPRLQWLLLTDSLELTNTTMNRSSKETKTKSMYGIGLAGKVDFSRLVGGGGGMIDPYIKFAAAIGQGDDVRYNTWEIFASIFKGDSIFGTTGSGFWRFPRLGVGIDVGWVQYYFATVGKDEDTYVDQQQRTIRCDTMHYRLNVPYVRGTITF